MKLIGWHIFGFGKFENYKVTSLSGNLQTIYGENEAGKSTLIAFIESILFGFSTRKEDSYNAERYIRFGGELFIEVDGTPMTIQRTKGKASGDVLIQYHDGATGDEKDLVRMLKGMDRRTFRQIFFCNLNTLYEHTDHNEDSWNSILYEAGMTGGTSLLTIDKELEKRQSELFKPGGRKPLINQRLDEWEKIKKSLRELEKKNSTYNDIVEKVKTLENSIKENKILLDNSQQKRRELDHEKTIYPLIRERVKLQRQLESLPEHTPFPEDGLTQIDKWKERIAFLSGEVESTQNVQIEIKNEIEKQKPFKDSNNFFSNVDYWNERLVLYRTKKEEKNRIEREKKNILLELDSKLNEVELSWNHAEKISTSFNAKEELKHLINQYLSSNQQYDYLNESLVSAREELEKEEAEYEHLKDRISQEPKTKGAVKQPKFRSSSLMLLISLFLLIGIGLTENWLLGLGSAAIVFFGAVVMNLTTERYTRFEAEYSAAQQEVKRRAENKEEQLDRLNRVYVKAAEKVDKWELERFKLEEKLERWKSTYSFPDNLSPDLLLEYFEKVAAIKQMIENYKVIESQLVELDYEVQVVEDGINKICEETGVAYNDAEKSLQQLDLIAIEQKEKLKKIEILNEELNSQQRKEKDLQAKLDACNDHFKQLLSHAEVETEEEFRVKGNARTEAKELLRQKIIVDSQLEGMDNAFMERSTNRSSLQEIQEERESVENEEGILIKKQQELYQDVASLQEQLRSFTEDGTLESRLFQSQQKEDELQSLGRKWAVLRVASDLLVKAKAKYQDERLPAVLSNAERYFSTITEGRYTAIHPPSDKSSFRIQRYDGSTYYPSQLSRGTVEQLYLCIRIALVSITSIQLPVFLDDIFVNFDEKRAEKAKKFINDFSKEHQILLLTCHSTTLTGVGENILKLERTPLSMKEVN